MNLLKKAVLSLGILMCSMMSVKMGVRAEATVVKEITFSMSKPINSENTVGDIGIMVGEFR